MANTIFSYIVAAVEYRLAAGEKESFFDCFFFIFLLALQADSTGLGDKAVAGN